jgi:hypothetical protein
VFEKPNRSSFTFTHPPQFPASHAPRPRNTNTSNTTVPTACGWHRAYASAVHWQHMHALASCVHPTSTPSGPRTWRSFGDQVCTPAPRRCRKCTPATTGHQSRRRRSSPGLDPIAGSPGARGHQRQLQQSRSTHSMVQGVSTCSLEMVIDTGDANLLATQPTRRS